MKKNMAMMLAASALLGLSACATVSPSGNGASGPNSASSVSPDPAHNSRNSLDWAGTYKGVLPCADCEGIETTILLQADGGYSATMRYLSRAGAPLRDQGRFTWDESGGIITLAGAVPHHYRVGENRLIALAQDGSPVSGPLADRYILNKVEADAVAQGITEKYWKLVELRGQPVPRLEREPHFILKAEGGRVTGFGGCNGFGGSYTLDEATSRIRFGQMASTMMACSTGMDVEQQFHEILTIADNYSLSGDSLTLNRARMAPLARFEAVYLK